MKTFRCHSIHPDAFKAALTAECARRQEKLAYHKSLFIHREQLGHFSYIDLETYIQTLDTTEFHRCVAQQQTASLISLMRIYP